MLFDCNFHDDTPYTPALDIFVLMHAGKKLRYERGHWVTQAQQYMGHYDEMGH